MRFYGTGIYNLPAYVLNILQKSLTALRAEEAIRQADAQRAAWAKRDDYLAWIRAKQDLASPAQEIEVPVILAKDEAWFRANGLPYKLLDGA